MGLSQHKLSKRLLFYSTTFISIILLGCLVFAANQVYTSTGAASFTSRNEDVSSMFNFTINNTDTPTTANITQVNITFPAGFTFTDNTNFTNAPSTHTFSNNATTLSWNLTTPGLVTNNSFRYFSFNATAATPGTWNFTIVMMNSSTATSNSTIFVVINDTTPPATFVYDSSGDNDGANVSRSTVTINASVIDNGIIGIINLTLYNSTLSIINSSVSSIGSSSLFANFTGLSDGLYYVNGTVNDTFNNRNSTIGTRTIRVDTTNPTINSFTASSTGQTSITFSISGSDSGSGIQTCNIASSSGGSASDNEVTGLSCDTEYDVTARCTDYAGLQTSTTDDFTTSACSSGSSSGGGSGSSGTGGSTATWTNTYPDDSTELSAKTDGVTRTLSAKWRIRLKIASETHYVGILSLTSSTATVEVSSTPQTKTLSIGQSTKFDANTDGFYDMTITLVSISNSQANLKVVYLHEEVPAGAQQNQTSTTSTTTTSETEGETASSLTTTKKVVLIIAAILILGVVAFVAFRKRKKVKALRGH